MSSRSRKSGDPREDRARAEAAQARANAKLTRDLHDDQCENRPGGQYHGKTIGTGPVPCHCAARAAGRARAEREIARQAKR